MPNSIVKLVFAEEISEGNLNPNFPKVPNDEIGMLAISFKNMSKEVFRVLEAIRQKSRSIAAGSLNDADSTFFKEGFSTNSSIKDSIITMTEYCKNRHNQRPFG